MDIQRRTVLQAGGLIAVGGVVAACSSSSGDAASSAAASAPDSSAAASPAGSPAASGSGGAGAVAQTADIPVGGGVIIDDPAVVITQPTEGEFKAFTAICTHQGCLVSEVVDNEIVCPCHGSKFSASDGSVIQGPAQSPLTAAGVAVEGGSVVLS
jgi:nitrite reductase/ring-hydroxylating ferredoxin subunit